MALQNGVSIRNVGELGTISGTRTINDSVNSTSYSDFYRFSMDKGSITARLSSLSSDANIRLVRDANRNNVIDSGDEITRSVNVGTANDSFTIDGLGRGTYIMEVNLQGSTGSTPYKLDLTTIAGRVDFESEPNNSISAPDYIDGYGKINLNGDRHMRGTVTSGTDPVDVYRFKVDAPSFFSASLTNSNLGANFSVLDSQGQVVINSTTVTDPEFASVYASSDRLPTGTYFIKVNKVGTGSTTYDLDITGEPIDRGQMQVKLESVKAISDFEDTLIGNGQADFYAKMSINGSSTNVPEIEDNNNPVFNYTFGRDISASTRYVPLTISVYEADPLSDQTADINPVAGVSGLSLKYDTMTGKLYNSTGAYIGKENDLITLSGNGDGDRAAVSFRVSYNSIY